MADYQSQFTGTQIDAGILKSTQINKTAQQVNDSLQAVDNINAGITGAKVGEMLSKSASGSLTGSGVVDEGDKLFFPKDGRFPSGSIDVGPAITLSENGGFVQQKSHTLDKDYLMMMYENAKTGTSRPMYWERAAEEKNVVIQPVNTGTMSQSVFYHTPVANSQVNALYMDFVSSISNVSIEIVSLNTGKPIKYIPNEQAWKSKTGGLDIAAGINNILSDTPISMLTTYHLRFNFSKVVTVRSGASEPYFAVDRQLITQRGVLLQGEGTGSSDTAEQIRDKLETLTGSNRLHASFIQGINEVLGNIDGGLSNSSFDGTLNGGTANGN